MLKAIRMQLINRHQNNLLASYFCIKKACKLLARKYFWPTFRHDVEAYIKGCNVCLSLQMVKHKPYSDFQSLPILIY